MGRPKGSKNKTAKPVSKVKETVTVITEVSEPKKENIKEIGCSVCSHGKEHHYGSALNWCNSQGCNCLEWK